MRLNDLCNSQWEDLTKNHLPHPLLSQILLSLQTGSGDTAGILIVLIPRRVFVLWHTMWVWAATTCIEDWGGSLKQLFLLSWSVSSVIPLQGSDAFQCLHCFCARSLMKTENKPMRQKTSFPIVASKSPGSINPEADGLISWLWWLMWCFRFGRRW